MSTLASDRAALYRAAFDDPSHDSALLDLDGTVVELNRSLRDLVAAAGGSAGPAPVWDLPVWRAESGAPLREAVRFGHPSGTLRVGAQASRDASGEWRVTKAIMSRSSRVLMEGSVRVPADYAAGR